MATSSPQASRPATDRPARRPLGALTRIGLFLVAAAGLSEVGFTLWKWRSVNGGVLGDWTGMRDYLTHDGNLSWSIPIALRILVGLIALIMLLVPRTRPATGWRWLGLMLVLGGVGLVLADGGPLHYYFGLTWLHASSSVVPTWTKAWYAAPFVLCFGVLVALLGYAVRPKAAPLDEEAEARAKGLVPGFGTMSIPIPIVGADTGSQAAVRPEPAATQPVWMSQPTSLEMPTPEPAGPGGAAADATQVVGLAPEAAAPATTRIAEPVAAATVAAPAAVATPATVAAPAAAAAPAASPYAPSPSPVPAASSPWTGPIPVVPSPPASYHLYVAGDVVGPLTLDQARTTFSSTAFDPRVLVSVNGGAWSPAGSVADLG
jgi:hypothetical protein